MVEINVRRLRGDRFFETNQDKTIEVYKKSYENHGSMQLVRESIEIIQGWKEDNAQRLSQIEVDKK